MTEYFYLHKLQFSHRRFLSPLQFIYTVNFFYQYGPMDIYVMQYNSTFFLFVEILHLELGALSVSSCVLLIKAHHCWVDFLSIIISLHY